MKKYLFALLLFIIFVSLFVILGNQFWFPFEELRAQQSPSSNTEELLLLDRKVETFFSELAQSSSPLTTATVFEEIFRDGSSTQRVSSEAVDLMSRRFMELSSQEIGRLHVPEKIGTTPIGKDVILLRYLTKHDNAPLLWSFTFYRSPWSGSAISATTTMYPISNWNLIHIRFGTDLESVL